MKKLILLLLIKAIGLGIVVAFYHAGLSPDEAQYWSWSRELDWGYYSKPPAIAWQIWGTTALFGHSEFGVRAGALAIGFFLALAVYYLAKGSGQSEKRAFWAGVAMAFSPLGIYLSLAATTDGGAILFLTLGIAVVAKGLRDEEGPNYPLAGVWILLGALYKWTAFALWPFVLFFFIFFPKMRKWNVIWGVLISLFALLPPLYWNMTHEWATFKHVGGALGEGKGGNFFDFLGAQIGLLSPIYFALLIAAFAALRKESNRALFFCGAFPFAVLIYLVAALFTKMQPNWAAYLYPPGMALIAWAAYPRHRAWLHAGTWLSIVMIGVAFFFPWYTFRQAVGWDRLAPALKEAGYDPRTAFLMGDKYQTASILSFYSPSQKRAYFFNISNTRKNQFSYWPQIQEREVGNTGYFVVLEKTHERALPWYESHYLKELGPYFEKVSYVGAYPLYERGGEPVKYALIFKCEGYLGEAPADPEAY
ncbi:MAG: glycosyltransferase family 39 protein [Chlamydiales bacterium]|nr:glycosyltransferase family 39 protein [Chlamydiales bacterium]